MISFINLWFKDYKKIVIVCQIQNSYILNLNVQKENVYWWNQQEQRPTVWHVKSIWRLNCDLIMVSKTPIKREEKNNDSK